MSVIAAECLAQPILANSQGDTFAAVSPVPHFASQICTQISIGHLKTAPCADSRCNKFQDCLAVVFLDS